MPASGGGTTGVIPLSVEMLSDSDDEDDHKPQVVTSIHSSVNEAGGLAPGPAAGSVSGKSKLLLLKMASEVVEAAAAAASRQPPTPSTCTSSQCTIVSDET